MEETRRNAIKLFKCLLLQQVMRGRFNFANANSYVHILSADFEGFCVEMPAHELCKPIILDSPNRSAAENGGTRAYYTERSKP